MKGVASACSAELCMQQAVGAVGGGSCARRVAYGYTRVRLLLQVLGRHDVPVSSPTFGPCAAPPCSLLPRASRAQLSNSALANLERSIGQMRSMLLGMRDVTKHFDI